MPSARTFQLTTRSVGGGGGGRSSDEGGGPLDHAAIASPKPRAGQSATSLDVAEATAKTIHRRRGSLLRNHTPYTCCRYHSCALPRGIRWYAARTRPFSLLLGGPASPSFCLTQLLIACRAQLVELKNGETYNGELVSCDNWMNIRCACECIVVPKSVGTRPHANSTVARSLTFNVFACLAACAASSAPRATATDFGGCRR